MSQAVHNLLELVGSDFDHGAVLPELGLVVLPELGLIFLSEFALMFLPEFALMFLPELALVGFGLHARHAVVYTPFMGLLLAEPLGRHADVFVLGVVFAVFLDQLDGGLLEDERFFVFVVGTRLAVVVVLAV